MLRGYSILINESYELLYEIADSEVEDDAYIAAEQEVPFSEKEVPFSEVKRGVPRIVVYATKSVVEVRPKKDRERRQYIAHVYVEHAETSYW